MINKDNKIYILGGNPMNKNNLVHYKIAFSDYNNNNDNSINHTKISSIVILKNPSLINNRNLFFCGQQEFIKYCDLFININMERKLVSLKKYLFQ